MAYNMDLEDRIEELGEPVKRICVKRACVRLSQLMFFATTHSRTYSRTNILVSPLHYPFPTPI